MGDYKIERYWSDHTAKYYYRLLERDSTGYAYKDGKIDLLGDYAWAKRIAKHYKIKLPSPRGEYNNEG